jgi:hypothetical protein
MTFFRILRLFVCDFHHIDADKLRKKDSRIGPVMSAMVSTTRLVLRSCDGAGIRTLFGVSEAYWCVLLPWAKFFGRLRKSSQLAAYC